MHNKKTVIAGAFAILPGCMISNLHRCVSNCGPMMQSEKKKRHTWVNA